AGDEKVRRRRDRSATFGGAAASRANRPRACAPTRLCLLRPGQLRARCEGPGRARLHDHAHHARRSIPLEPARGSGWSAGAMTKTQAPFWKTKTLAEMSEQEWESLCDGCGKCCLAGIEDEDTGEIFLTDVACKLFDSGLCRCSNYENRQKL